MNIEFFCSGINHRAQDGHFEGGVGVYLHGRAEAQAGFDIPSSNVDLSTLENGVYDTKLNEKCGYTLFMWRTKSGGMLRGLVVENEDENSVEYAKNLYNKQPIFI